MTKHNKATMEEVKRLRNFLLEVFKTTNHSNPKYMKEMLQKSTLFMHRPLNLQVNQNNTTKYGVKCALGPYIWNNFPEHIKIGVI